MSSDSKTDKDILKELSMKPRGSSNKSKRNLNDHQDIESTLKSNPNINKYIQEQINNALGKQDTNNTYYNNSENSENSKNKNNDIYKKIHDRNIVNENVS